MEQTFDVFISYSFKDQKIAEGICGFLEKYGVRCFVAYRDIPKGVVWAGAIANAIDASKMMVVIFSKDFNASPQTDREIELASENKIPILTYRVTDAEFTGAKKYYLKNLNWIDAFPNPESCFGHLRENVCKLLKRETSNLGNEKENQELDTNSMKERFPGYIEGTEYSMDLKVRAINGNSKILVVTGIDNSSATDILVIDQFQDNEGNTCKIVGVDSRAFWGNKKIRSIVLPNSITSIGEWAFDGCENLESFVLPDSVLEIGEKVFWGCPKIKSPIFNRHIFAYMPSTYSGSYRIPKGIKSIADGAFAGCNQLGSIAIPDSVISIGDNAFNDCTKLSSIVIPESVTHIGKRAIPATCKVIRK